MNTFFSPLRRELERDVANVQAGKEAERVEEIQFVNNPILRLSQKAILHFALENPARAEKLSGAYIDNAVGYEYLGAGSEQTVIANTSHVLKIHRASSDMSEKNRTELLGRMRFEYAVLEHYMDGFMLPQSISISKNPLNFSEQAIIAKQEKINYEPVNIFSRFTRMITPSAFEKINNDRSLKRSLGKLSKFALSMANHTEMVPDLSGPSNLVLMDKPNSPLGFDKKPELKLIEGRAIEARDNPIEFDKTYCQLTDLQANLS